MGITTNWAVALALTVLPAALPALAEGPPTLTGEGITARSLTLETLAAIPATEVDATYQTQGGPRSEHYAGYPLWSVLSDGGALSDHKAALRRVVLVTGRDGHQVAFSLGEIMPDFGRAAVLLSWQVNGAPTPDGLRMVVPGDLRGGRYVKDVATIELR